MSDQIVVSFDTVRLAAEDLASTTAQVQDILQDMQANLRPLETDWTGAASEAYQAVQAEWNSDINEMVELLGTLSGTVEEAGQTYQSTEGEVRDAWA